MSGGDIPNIGILLVEDEGFIRSTLRRMLQSLGASSIAEAPDGEAALTLLERGLIPQLVICDVQMTPMDGLTFLRRLREMPDQAQAAVPVVMLTAVADESTIQDTVSLNIAGYVLKPVSRRLLAERINAIFRRAEATALAPARPG